MGSHGIGFMFLQINYNISKLGLNSQRQKCERPNPAKAIAVLLLGILKKGPDPARTFKKRANQNISGPHPFNAKHPFNIYLCNVTILQEAFISIITNFLFLKNTFKIQKIYYNRFLPFLLSRDKKSRTISSSKC